MGADDVQVGLLLPVAGAPLQLVQVRKDQLLHVDQHVPLQFLALLFAVIEKDLQGRVHLREVAGLLFQLLLLFA